MSIGQSSSVSVDCYFSLQLHWSIYHLVKKSRNAFLVLFAILRYDYPNTVCWSTLPVLAVRNVRVKTCRDTRMRCWAVQTNPKGRQVGRLMGNRNLLDFISLNYANWNSFFLQAPPSRCGPTFPCSLLVLSFRRIDYCQQRCDLFFTIDSSIFAWKFPFPICIIMYSANPFAGLILLEFLERKTPLQENLDSVHVSALHKSSFTLPIFCGVCASALLGYTTWNQGYGPKYWSGRQGICNSEDVGSNVFRFGHFGGAHILGISAGPRTKKNSSYIFTHVLCFGIREKVYESARLQTPFATSNWSSLNSCNGA